MSAISFDVDELDEIIDSAYKLKSKREDRPALVRPFTQDGNRILNARGETVAFGSLTIYEQLLKIFNR